ncbi:MAG: hypothetical protein K2O14_02245 [Oscillospiraceae bacterium]|nr:hypothetical protein [Oscillospiraceae bacterium]
MLTQKTNYILNNKAPKAILLAAAALILYTIAFALLYNSCHDIPRGVFMISFSLLVTLSAQCAADFVTTLSRCNIVKYMVTAAVVTALELTPLPYIWVYSAMDIDPADMGEHIGRMWRQAAVVFLIVLLLTAGIFFIKRRYRLKIGIEKV